VDSQVVREFTASGAGADPAASFSTTAPGADHYRVRGPPALAGHRGHPGAL